MGLKTFECTEDVHAHINIFCFSSPNEDFQESRHREGSWRSLALWWVSGQELDAGEEEEVSPFRWCLLVDQTEGKNTKSRCVFLGSAGRVVIYL